MDRDTAPCHPGTRRHSRWRAALTVIWFASSFGTLYFARELSPFTMFGWPLSYWLAAQGCVLGFFMIAAAYAAVSDAPDDKETDTPGSTDG